MATSINKKVNHIYTLMERLAKGEELYSKDEEILDEFDINERTLDRYLKDIHDIYRHIIVTEKKNKEFTDRKVTVYRVVDREKDVGKILKYFMENSSDLGWILQMIHENDPSFLKEMDVSSRRDIEDSIKEDEGVFTFVGSPFETFDDTERKAIFSQLKKAVKLHEYHTIVYRKNKRERLENLKCLKLVYMNNNWYLATENDDKWFRFLRLSFIEKVEYTSDGRETFQGSRVDFYQSYFTDLQNAMTLVGKQFEIATLKVSPRVAIYFMEDMKPFFPSQQYIETLEDGSVVFSVEYTQEMEILPFVKQWQPDMTILSPEGLKTKLTADLKKGIENNS